MEAIKVTQKIHSQTLHIQELERFQGQTVEIIIMSLEQISSPSDITSAQTPRKNAGGMLARYKNIALIEQEAKAWELAVKEKYATR